MTLGALNELACPAFVDAIGWVFEHSPWVAERTCPQRPFADREALHAAMIDTMRHAERDEQLALLRAHPDLGTRARISDASTGEQSGAGLDRLTRDDFERLQQLNDAYRTKFGFPFLYAVKGSTSQQIIAALEQRVLRSTDEEFEEALGQVARIAWFRIESAVEG